MKEIFLIILLAFGTYNAQDSLKSEAFKKNPFMRSPVFKPKYASYPLVAGYLLVKEANNGDPFAEHELGLRYLLGRGFAPDTSKAVFWIRKAAEQNLATANFNYAIMLMNGLGVDWNPFEAFKYAKKAAEAGMPEAQYLYGTFYLDNLVVNRNLNEAYKWVSLAADKKIPQAEELIKRLEKYGVKKRAETKNTNIVSSDSMQNELSYSYNPKTDLLNSGWELSFYSFGDKDSLLEERKSSFEILLQKNRGKLFQKLGLDTLSAEFKNKSSLQIIKETASYGSPNAFKLLGKMHELGIELPRDTILALQNYLRSLRLGAIGESQKILMIWQNATIEQKLRMRVKKDNATAKYVWAALAALGFDFSITKKQAFDLLKQAGEEGNIPALIELGLAYFNGTLVEKNFNKAQMYWDEAVKHGNKESLVRIAFSSILNGRAKKSLKNEFELLENAAERGSTPALEALGFCYEKGFGRRENKAKAAEYYRKAYFLGDGKAYESLKALYDSIRPPDKMFRIYGD